MSSTRKTSRERLIEGILLAMAGFFAVVFVAPAAVELVQAKETERAERLRTEMAQADVQKKEQELLWLTHDPLADSRLPQ